MESTLPLQDGIDGETGPPPAIYIVSGGAGASGEQLVRTVLAQFGRVNVPLEIVPWVHTLAKIDAVVEDVARSGGILVHTMVNGELRRELVERAEAAGVLAIDLVGPLLTHLADLLQKAPAGQPGLYRQLRREYFERIEAMEFTLKHDDGERPDDLPQAEIVLVGVSRVGKTPTSMYLSIQGWKVANVPLVPGIEPPPELFLVKQKRVIGLNIEPLQLLVHRRWRQQHLGIPSSDYADQRKIGQELRDAQRFFYQHGFAVVNVTNKPIETIADEVIALIV